MLDRMGILSREGHWRCELVVSFVDVTVDPWMVEGAVKIIERDLPSKKAVDEIEDYG